MSFLPFKKNDRFYVTEIERGLYPHGMVSPTQVRNTFLNYWYFYLDLDGEQHFAFIDGSGYHSHHHIDGIELISRKEKAKR